MEGTGKSGVLLYLTMWAHKAGWLVLSVPSMFTWTQIACKTERHNSAGLFL